MNNLEKDLTAYVQSLRCSIHNHYAECEINNGILSASCCCEAFQKEVEEKSFEFAQNYAMDDLNKHFDGLFGKG